MKNSSIFKILLLSSSLFCFQPAFAEENVDSIVKDGSFFGEARYRYERVEQDGLTKDANASTVRTNIGFKTGEYRNFQALLEGQLVQNIGASGFNDTVNMKATHPVVADPDNAEINQAWLSWTGLPDTSVKAGRQGINLDNQRFIGTVGWRQNDQTFDSALIKNSTIQDFTLLYGYFWNINRVFGGDHPLGDLDTDTHLFNASYTHYDWMNITGYSYLLDIDSLPNISSKTYGLRLRGDIPIHKSWTLSYTTEIATQDDHALNATNSNEEYVHITPSLKGHGLLLQAGYEELGGNGTSSFQTPLATLHKFNGWADKFLSTPTTGLQDSYARISYTIPNSHEWIDGTKLTAVYHDFEGDTQGDYGSELDLSIGKTFKLPQTISTGTQPFKSISTVLKYADYNADDAPFTDTQKIWFQVGVKF